MDMKVTEFLDLGFKYIDSKVVDNKEISYASIDTRTIEAGDIFFALKGEKVDGNEFVNEAIKKDASLIVTDSKKVFDNCKFNSLLVDNVLETIYEIGRIRFKNFNKKKIVITGSFGKTTTKEILRDMLSVKFKVYSTHGNFNNKLGVSLTGIGIDDSADLAVIEIGSSAKGEIAELAEIIEPSVAIITNIGHAHVGRFGSIEAIVDEKLSVARYLKNGTVFIPFEFKKNIIRNGDVYKVITFGKDGSSDIRLNEVRHTANGIEFSVQNFGGVFFINYCYEHIAYNCLPLIYLASSLGMSSQQIELGLSKNIPFISRGAVIKVNNLEILDDSYNAGLESMLGAMRSLAKFADKNKTAIIGEIAEIEGFEDDVYKRLIDEAVALSDINFIFIGESFAKYNVAKNIKVFKDKKSAKQDIIAINDGIVLVKASHSKGFNEVVELLKNETTK